jgi:fatty-acyl-CoA synthase
MNLSEVIRHHADRYPQAQALSTADVVVSYAELLTRVQRTAGALRSLGVGPGDVVAALLSNGLEFADIMCASSHLGAIFLPLNWRLAPPELSYICGHAGAGTVICSLPFVDRLDDLATDGAVRNWVSTGEPMGRWLGLRDLVRAADAVEDPHPVSAEAPHRLMYTSGTTSRPKGVVTSYSNLYWKCASQLVELDLTRHDRGLVCAPLFHVGALDITLTNMLYVGGSTHIIERFAPHPVLDALDALEITNVFLAPVMIALALRSDALVGRTIPSLRVLTHGGERITERTLDALEQAFPNAWVTDAYGLTETVSCDTFLPRSHVRSKRGSVGKPVLHARVRIVDPEGRPVPALTTGEITVSGPKVCSEYWKDPETTALAIRHGWLHTGDVGYLDEDGFLYVVDRLKDIIRSGSENVASLEVERVVLEHPAVQEVAVVGRPDERWGEVPVAYVALRDGQAATAEELDAGCRARLASYKTPKAFRLVEALPRNSAGKVLKQELRSRELQATKEMKQ